MATTSLPLTPAEIAKALGCNPANVRKYWPGIEAACREHGLSDRPSTVAVLATIATEVASFRPINEFGGPRYFTKLYEGRRDLGNVRPGDGVRYHGRGFIQLTGRANYRSYGKKLGVPLEEQPELALDPVISARILARYFKDRGIAADARAGDWKTVRRKVNGGLNGWDHFIGHVRALNQASRTKQIMAAKAAAKAKAAKAAKAKPKAPPIGTPVQPPAAPPA